MRTDHRMELPISGQPPGGQGAHDLRPHRRQRIGPGVPCVFGLLFGGTRARLDVFARRLAVHTRLLSTDADIA